MTTDLEPRAVRVLLKLADNAAMSCDGCEVEGCADAHPKPCDWAKAEAEAWLAAQPRERRTDDD